MSIDRFFTTPVTIIEPGTAKDKYDNDVPDWDHPLSETDTSGWLTQVTSAEQLGERDVTETRWELSLPVGTSISSIARVLAGSTTYEVDGSPNVSPQTPDGGQHHVVVRLNVVAEVLTGGS